MNLKHQRYLEARRAGLSIEECVKAALPGVDPTSERFQNWVATAETHIADKYIQRFLERSKSLSYICDNILALKEFLKWLERHHGYRSKINYNHIDYLNLSQNQKNTAKAVEYQKAYKFEDIINTIRKMQDQTEREKRNKALISLQALCSLRISELRTVKIKNLIQEDGVYFIWALTNAPRDSMRLEHDNKVGASISSG